jgi:hypothetical protein
MLVKGKFALTWGANTLEDVEEVEVGYEQRSDEYDTVQHNVREVDGPIKASVTLTLLATDIASLAAILPQYYVAEGETMSTGETVDCSMGAIDVVNTCEADTFNDLDIESCQPQQVFRLVNARTKIDSIMNEKSVRKIKVKFIGEPGNDEASVQFFNTGCLS